MAGQSSRERELARAAEELHGATTDLLQLKEILERFPDLLIETIHGSSISGESPSDEEARRVGYEAGFREQPEPRTPFLSGADDPTLAERFEDELHSSESSRR